MNERTKKRTLAIFILVSFVCAFAYYMPSLRYTFYDQMKSAFMLTDTQMGLVASLKPWLIQYVIPFPGILHLSFQPRSFLSFL